MGSEKDPSLEVSFRRRPKPERGVADAPAAVETPQLEEPKQIKAPKPPRAPRRPLAMPRVDGHVAAALTGLVVGAFLVLAGAGSLRLCESLRGTSSCGGPGFALLLAIVLTGWLLGTGLLRLAGTRSPSSISFLAVALVAVLSVLFLTDALQEWSGAAAVLVITVAAYVLSHWVTTSYIDP